MKIVHIVLGKANPNRMNGVNKVVNQLITEQVNRGYDAELWGITSNLSHDYNNRPYTTRLFAKNPNPFAIDKTLIGAMKEVPKTTILHLHGAWIPCFSAIIKYARIKELKVIVTPHGGYNKIAMKKNGLVKQIYWRLFEKNVVRNAASIHCLGESEVVGLKKIFPTGKHYLIPYGFSFKTSSLATPKSKNGQLIVGFVGRIDVNTKGLDILVQAFKQVDTNIKLWVIGDGKEVPYLQTLIDEAKLNDKVTLFGGQYGEDKDALIDQMDVFVHPSRNEGLPSAVLEACSHGVPVIVSKQTNLASYVQRCQSGIALVNNGPEDLSAAINNFNSLTSEQLEDYRMNAADMVTKEFSWTKVLDEMHRMYFD